MFADPGLACHKMNLQLFDALIADMPLCLPSLRLLVPPLQLMCASMWQVVKKQDVMNYWKVAEFVSLVTEMVPELLFCKNRDQLIIGMKARHILELCRIEYSVDPKIVTSHLDRIRLLSPTSEHVSEANFLKLVHSLLKDPEENEHFFKEVFPAEYGSQYDKDLQTLFWEFLCRLAQLLPPPNLQQTASWLGNAPVVEDCVHIVSESQHLRSLLQHFKNVGHLDKHVPPSPMGDCIVSALSFIPTEKDMITINQASCECRLERSQNVLFDISPLLVDNLEEEKISVTDYAEVELGPTSDSEVIIEGSHNEETTIEAVKGEVVVEVNGDEVVYEIVGKTLEEHKCDGEDLILLGEPNVHSNRRLKKTFGRHECPDCKKSFKFASALIAHRVIHTGERPFGCNECGRCFSFRQSLDRHKQRHKEKCKYDCGICEDTFPSLFACTEHKNNHMEDGVYVCPECHRRFTFDSALARHMKRHTGGKTVERLQTEPKKLQMEQENVGILDNLQDVDFAIADTHQDLALNGEKYDVIPKVECDQPAVKEMLATTVVDNSMSFVKARTSGRKRKPTMKIQIINLQKRIAKVSSANKRVPDVKSVPFNSTEHSYGSPKASSREKDETHLQLPMGRAHCDKALEQTSTSQSHTEQNGRYTCLDCEKSFKFLSLLRAHQHVHTGRRPYLCSQCGRHFSFKQSLKRHKHTHKDGCKYVCHICGAFFKSIAAQREHNSSHMQHGLYRCPECDRTFAWKSTLVRHLKTHTVEADKSGEGSHCELNLIGGTSLSNSLSTHQAEKLHSCSCGKSFAYKSGLKAHQRTHIKERPHQCQECGKGFLYKGGLLSHMKIHSKDMPYSCSFCGKSFKRERNMKKHERCHTGENVFSCSQCDKSFVYKATLIRHELTHSGERPFLCSECGKGFFSHAELLKHERFHTGHKPFQCPHCGKRFTQSCYLTIHLRYHTGARPYSCSHCNKSFLSANRLKRHQRTHTGEKPYLCGECGKGFKESYNLKMHQRTHTPKFR